jgi:hypothetical protein
VNSIPCYSDCFYAGIGQNRHGRKKTDGSGCRPQDQDRNSFEFPERDVIKKLEILIILKLGHYQKVRNINHFKTRTLFSMCITWTYFLQV